MPITKCKTDCTCGLHRNRKKICTVDGCGEDHLAKGLCEKHYGRKRRTGTTDYSGGKSITCEDGCTCNRHREGKPFDASLTYEERKRVNETEEQREHRLSHGKEYYSTNRDWFKKRSKKYHNKNRDEILIKNRIRYHNNLDYYRLQRKTWREKNLERCKEMDRKWSKNRRLKNPGTSVKDAERNSRRRAQLKAGEDFTHDERNEYWEAQGMDPKICSYCDKQIKNWKSSIGDHVVPLSKGGTHTMDNVVPCCLPCNSSKNDRILYEEWVPINERTLVA